MSVYSPFSGGTPLLLRARCSLEFDIPFQMPFIFMLRPRSGAQQWVVREEYLHSPTVPIQEFTDSYGNLCQRLLAPEGWFSIDTRFDVVTAACSDVSPGAPFVDIAALPDSILSYFSPEEGWVEFDPTNNARAAVQHIVTAEGRDYYDVTPLKGVIFGGGKNPILEVSVDVARK